MRHLLGVRLDFSPKYIPESPGIYSGGPFNDYQFRNPLKTEIATLPLLARNDAEEITTVSPGRAVALLPNMSIFVVLAFYWQAKARDRMGEVDWTAFYLCLVS